MERKWTLEHAVTSADGKTLRYTMTNGEERLALSLGAGELAVLGRRTPALFDGRPSEGLVTP